MINIRYSNMKGSFFKKDQINLDYLKQEFASVQSLLRKGQSNEADIVKDDTFMITQPKGIKDQKFSSIDDKVKKSQKQIMQN